MALKTGDKGVAANGRSVVFNGQKWVYEDEKLKDVMVVGEVTPGASAKTSKPATASASEKIEHYYQDIDVKGKSALYRKNAELLKKPEVIAFLKTLRFGEGTDGELGYNTEYGGGVFTDLSKKPGKKTFSTATGQSTSAEGAYQFQDSTWNRLAKKLGLNDFSKQSQDIAAIELLNEQKATNLILNGKPKEALHKVASTWYSIPTENGKSADGKQPVKPIGQLVSIFSNEKIKAADQLTRQKNVKKWQQYFKPTKENIAEKKRIVKEFHDKIAEIKKQKYSPANEKAMIDQVVEEAYQNGDLSIINSNIAYRQKKYDDFEKRYPADYDEAIKKGVAEGMDKERYKIHRKYLKKGGSSELQGTLRWGNVPDARPDFFYRKNLQLSDWTPEENTEDPEAAAENAENSQSNTSSESSDYETTKPKPWSPDDLFNSLSAQTMVADPQFKYIPGKEKIPYDAIASLGVGIMGVGMGKVDLKDRDEQVSEGLLNYAAMRAKIMKMGLEPEVEADLNNKLASAYQTGLTNIVRASNGNRNLVLGNQGQLDSARMKSITEIALADVARRDKAASEFGEVMKYISEFDANRDIANNERHYNLDLQKQQAASQVAQQGFANLIDNLQYQRENGPGSANDMYKNFLMWHITGVNPNAKDDGQPGSASYAEKIRTQNLVREENIKSMKTGLMDLTTEQQKSFDEFRKSNSKYNWETNKDFNPEEAMTAWKKSAGLIALTDEEYQAKMADVNAGNMVDNNNAVTAGAEKYKENTSPLIKLSRKALKNDAPMSESPFANLPGVKDTGIDSDAMNAFQYVLRHNTRNKDIDQPWKSTPPFIPTTLTPPSNIAVAKAAARAANPHVGLTADQEADELKTSQSETQKFQILPTYH